METKKRGFASLSPERRYEISSKGGVAVHKKGTAHKWDSDAAVTAGRKGGINSASRRRQNKERVQA